MADARYLDIKMPDHFALEIRDARGNWEVWGTYLAEYFERLEDGSYVCGGIDGGSPTWLRCVAHRDGYFEHIDGDGHGEVHAYRIVALDPDKV